MNNKDIGDETSVIEGGVFVWVDGRLVSGVYTPSEYELYMRDSTTSRFLKKGLIPPFNRRSLFKRLRSLFVVKVLGKRVAGLAMPSVSGG